MIRYVLAMGKQHLGPHVVVGYGIKMFCLFITSPDHLVDCSEMIQQEDSIKCGMRVSVRINHYIYGDLTTVKSALAKRSQHLNATDRHIVGCKMLHAFGHPVESNLCACPGATLLDKPGQTTTTSFNI